MPDNNWISSEDTDWITLDQSAPKDDWIYAETPKLVAAQSVPSTPEPQRKEFSSLREERKYAKQTLAQRKKDRNRSVVSTAGALADTISGGAAAVGGLLYTAPQAVAGLIESKYGNKEVGKQVSEDAADTFGKILDFSSIRKHFQERAKEKGVNMDEFLYSDNPIDSVMSALGDFIDPSTKAYFGEHPEAFKKYAASVWQNVVAPMGVLGALGKGHGALKEIAKPGEPVTTAADVANKFKQNAEAGGPIYTPEESVQGKQFGLKQKNVVIDENGMPVDSIATDKYNTEVAKAKGNDVTLEEGLPAIDDGWIYEPTIEQKLSGIEQEALPSNPDLPKIQPELADQTQLPQIDRGLGADVTESTTNPYINPTMTDQVLTENRMAPPIADAEAAGAYEMHSGLGEMWSSYKDSGLLVPEPTKPITESEAVQLHKQALRKSMAQDPQRFTDMIANQHQYLSESQVMLDRLWAKTFPEDTTPFSESIRAGESLPSFGGKVFGNKQSGAINLKEIFSKDSPIKNKVMDNIIDRLVTPYDSIDKLFEGVPDLFPEKGKPAYQDPTWTSNIVTPTTVRNFVNNPLISYATSHIRDANAMVHMAKDKWLSSFVDDWQKTVPDESRSKILGALMDINRASEREKRGNAPVDDATLTSKYKFTPEEIEAYRTKYQPLLKELHESDAPAINSFTGGKRVDYAPLSDYISTSHGYGRHTVTATLNGEMYYHRFKSLAEAKEMETAMRDTGAVVKRAFNQADQSSLNDALLEISANANGIKKINFLGNIADKILGSQLTAQKAFEFERSAKDIAGKVGESEDNVLTPQQLKEVEAQQIHRINGSADLKGAAYIQDKVRNPFVDNKEAIEKAYPNTYKFVDDWTKRSLGANISEIKLADKAIQGVLETVYKTGSKVSSMLTFNKIGNKDAFTDKGVLSPKAAEAVATFMTSLSSSYLLAGNWGNLIMQATTPIFAGIANGFPDVAAWTGSPLKAAVVSQRAYLKTLVDYTTAKLGVNKEAAGQLATWQDRGDIAAHMFEDLPVGEEVYSSALERGTQKLINVPRKVFNDPIERFTNEFMGLYYKNVLNDPLLASSKDAQTINKAAIELSNAAKGLYTDYNKPLIYSKAGTAGKFMSNFSIWGPTQIARLATYAKNPDSGKAIAGLVSLVAATTMISGIKGWPGAQDYDNIQKMFPDTLKPLDLAMKDAKIPEEARDGVLLNGSIIPQVDLSNSGRYSPFLVSGVPAFGVGKKIGNISGFLKDILMSPEKLSQEEIYNFSQAVPPALKGVANQVFNTRPIGNGDSNVIGKDAKPIYTQRGEIEKNLNLFGLNSARQTNEKSNFWNKIWEDKQIEKNNKKADEAVKLWNSSQAIQARNPDSKLNQMLSERMATGANSQFSDSLNTNPNGGNTLMQKIKTLQELQALSPEEKAARDLSTSGSPAAQLKGNTDLSTLQQR